MRWRRSSDIHRHPGTEARAETSVGRGGAATRASRKPGEQSGGFLSRDGADTGRSLPRGWGSSDRVVPMLTKQQIAEMRDFAEKMPYSSTISKEFTDAASLAERWYEQRAAAQEQEQTTTYDRSSRHGQEAPSQP